MSTGITCTASITVDTPASKVWQALTTPAIIKQYMLGSDVVTTWKEGDPIVWKGEYEGKKYEDKGVILKVIQEKELDYTHYSPLGGKEDKPENYHTVTTTLVEKDGKTELTLTQDNNEDEEAKKHTQKFWQDILGSLKKIVEA